MARDYKTRANPRPKKQQTPGWVWFSAGLLVGLFAAGLLWLKLGQPQQAPATRPLPSATAPPPRPAGVADRPAALPPKPRFDFYTTLPEMEVVVPEPDPVPKQATPKKSAPAAPAATGSTYMLQMGSFRRYADADRMKASLALLGIQAEIQKVTINNKETYHRVRSGPYRSGQQVNQVRDLLRQNGINNLLIKLKR